MTRPMLTQREAAAACGVSRTTIRRRREAGGLPGAVQDEARGWLIPVEDLLAAGFRLNAPAGPDSQVHRVTSRVLTVYSEKGGVGMSALSAGLVAAARRG
ncbi:helix-turn-helix domain-containing protein [Streptomyces parvus]|uniref:helix-turn-helix domain-containing protein n=1 Tax=Streptomyces parvus TaxID=66428 RepID=UPI0037FB0B1A